MKSLKTICNEAMRQKRTIHFLPPYRGDIMIQVFDLLGIHPNQQKESASMPLNNAVVKMRSTKTQEEIEDDSRDFLPAQSEVDVVALIEDEIILDLPSAPRHESCVLPASAQDNPEDSPFAVLKGLRSKAQ